MIVWQVGLMLSPVQEKIKDACNKSQRSFNSVQLVCVTKQRSIEDIQKLYGQGERIFGESRIQEAEEKIQTFGSDVKWHFIGHLQSNKAKKAVGVFDLIHSVDSLSLAEKIDREAQIKNIKQNILLEVNVSGEVSKHGFRPKDLLQAFPELLQLKSLQIQGLMTMAPAYTTHSAEEESCIRECFRSLRQLKEQLCAAYPEIQQSFIHLSMGMSQDFEIAINEGATLIRIGSALFEAK